eukprot:350563-Chlamydomonas_euryale.AAC.1
MDSFKYAASLNEWDTWARHASHLAGVEQLVQLKGFRKLREPSGDESIYLYSVRKGEVGLSRLVLGEHGPGQLVEHGPGSHAPRGRSATRTTSVYATGRRAWAGMDKDLSGHGLRPLGAWVKAYWGMG